MILDILLGVNDIPQSEIIEPDFDTKPGEKVIGTASTRTQKLYAAIKKHRNETSALIKSASISKIGMTLEDLASEASKFEARIVTGDLLLQIFWQEARNDVGADGQEIGIRKGWQIVETQPEEEGVTEFEALSSLITAMAGPPCKNPDCPIHGQRS